MKKKISVLALIIAFMLTGCDDSTSPKNQDNSENVEIVSEEEMFTKRDYNTEYDVSESVLVKLKGDTVNCDSDAILISGTTVTIQEEGTYIFSGTLDNGMIVVDAEETDKTQIVLDNASITNHTSAALYILEADKVVVTLAEETENELVNGGTFESIDDNNIDGAVFSKQDLTFNGSGSLTVTSPTAHGIVCKDDLVFTSGSYMINSASHGLDANDSVRATRSSLSITSGKDGIHVENTDDTSLGFIYVADGTFDISAEGDGMSAGSYMQLKNGTFQIVSGGGSANATKQTSDSWGNFMGGGMMPGRGGIEGKHPGASQMPMQSSGNDTSSSSADSSTSIKGLKAAGNLLIENGTFTIDSADDAVHSNSSISVYGGKFEIASGDDGFHADEVLTISNGDIEITECYEGLEALDIKVSGGNIKLVASDDGLNAAGGTDASGMAGPRGNDQFGGRGGMSSSSNGSIVISGGELYVNASGDGIDANGYLEITGGYTVVVGPTQGDTATLDYDTSAIITGGTFIGTGASGMAQTFSNSEQGVFAVSVGTQAAGTEIVLKDSGGNVVISYTPELDFGVVILSNPDMKKGETYTITVGEATGEFEAS